MDLRHTGVSQHDIVGRQSADQVISLKFKLYAFDLFARLCHLQHDIRYQIPILLKFEVSHYPLFQLQLIFDIVSILIIKYLICSRMRPN